MAEERLIDDDKDRKYKIIINEKGEEELVIDTSSEEAEVPVFDLYDYVQDEQLTAEQAAEREYAREETAKLRAERTAELMQTARERLAAGEFEEARYALYQAEDLSGSNGEVYYLKLRILSRDLTSFVDLEKCALAADGVMEYSTDGQKSELLRLAGTLEEKIEQSRDKSVRLGEESNRGKDERRETFKRLKKNSLKIFLSCAASLAVFIALVIVFAAVMPERIAFIAVAGAVAALSFACTLISLKKYLSSAHDLKRNEDDGATSLGREYLESKREYELLTRIYNSVRQ